MLDFEEQACKMEIRTERNSMKRIILFLVGIGLTSCVNEQERRESAYRFEQTMRNQCEHTLGFPAGTQGYMECRMFYDKVLKYADIDTNYMSFSKAQQIQNRIDATTNKCLSYWGRDNMAKSSLWSCIKDQGQEAIDEAIHQKELKEQEDMLTRAIASGQKEANDDNRLQERIDAERERVAKETGKNPKKIKCKTYNKSNGYIQVKCK